MPVKPLLKGADHDYPREVLSYQSSGKLEFHRLRLHLSWQVRGKGVQAVCWTNRPRTGDRQPRLALQLLALTFVRTGELIGAKWEEFDFEQGYG